MNAATHAFTPAPAAPLGSEIAAFAASLDERDALYWPALAAADGCPDSLAELNAMLVECDCYPFDARSVWGMVGEGSAPHALPGVV